MLDNLTIILFRPKFPENVGGVARACANLGCSSLSLVAPRNWDPEKAKPMATPQGEPILARARLFDDLPSALTGHAAVWGTTARTGGWRRGIATPRAAAPELVEGLGAGGVAVVFGPEDTGLTNEEIQLCGRLLTIPTTEESSLNLAQAALVILYECFVEARERTYRDRSEGAAESVLAPSEDAPAGPDAAARDADRPAAFEEREALMGAVREALLAIDYLKPDNPDYWMLPVRRFFQRFPLRRREFNLLMGVCRQIRWAARRDR